MNQDDLITIIYLLIGVPIGFATILNLLRTTRINTDIEYFGLGCAVVAVICFWPIALIIAALLYLGRFLSWWATK